MKKFIFFLLCTIQIIAAFQVFAQNKLTPRWTLEFSEDIEWQRVHSLGYLIVCTRKGLYGIDPNTGKIAWENKNFASIRSEDFEEVPGTEFITIIFNRELSIIKKQAIIEVLSGKVLFDSREAEIGVMSRHVLAKSGRLLVVGAKAKEMYASLFMYDIASGKLLWANTELFKADKNAKGFFNKLQAVTDNINSLQPLATDPFELDAENILIVHPTCALRINSTTGEVIWKNSLQTAVRAKLLFSPYKKDVIFVGTEIESQDGSGFTLSNGTKSDKFSYNLYYSFDLKSGAPLWKQPAKEKDMLNQIIAHKNGLIICPRSSQKPTINLIDYESGKTVWGEKGKGVKAQGSVVSYLPFEKGILITTAFDNVFNSKAEEYYLNILDPESGTLKFKKSVKLLGDIVSSELVPKGLLFTTTLEINILELNTGELLWPVSIEAGKPFNSDKARPFPTRSSGKTMYVYSTKEEGLFSIDRESGIYKRMSLAKFRFEGKEFPNEITVQPDGIVISSEQNLLKLDLKGNQKYAKYFPAPRHPALLRALYLAAAIEASYTSISATAASTVIDEASQKTNDKEVKSAAQDFSQSLKDLSTVAHAYSKAAMREFNARLKASASTDTFAIIMTTQETKGNQLIQVSKESGEILNSIDIKNDREPEYDVDEVYNYIYYRLKDRSIVCYKLL